MALSRGKACNVGSVKPTFRENISVPDGVNSFNTKDSAVYVEAGFTKLEIVTSIVSNPVF